MRHPLPPLQSDPHIGKRGKPIPSDPPSGPPGGALGTVPTRSAGTPATTPRFPASTPMDPTQREDLMVPEGRNRRRHPRARGDWPVMVELPDGPHQARVRDISKGGVSFFLDRPIAEMSVLSVEFDLPCPAGVRRIRGTGAVVRCEKISKALDHYEIALFITEMADPDRATIESFVTEIQLT